jgi:hypothetical protein
MAKKLSKAAQWFENRFPARGESPTGQTDDG